MEQINEQHPHRGNWLREIVFGLNDGLVTTLVFIMAVSEVAPARLLLVVLGEVMAGGISMALGGFLSARTAKQILDQRIATERYEIEHEPEEERAELISIYQNWWLHPNDTLVALVATCPMVGLRIDRLDRFGTWSDQVPLYSSKFYASWSRISRGRHSGHVGRCGCGLAITWSMNE